MVAAEVIAATVVSVLVADAVVVDAAAEVPAVVAAAVVEVVAAVVVEVVAAAEAAVVVSAELTFCSSGISAGVSAGSSGRSGTDTAEAAVTGAVSSIMPPKSPLRTGAGVSEREAVEDEVEVRTAVSILLQPEISENAVSAARSLQKNFLFFKRHTSAHTVSHYDYNICKPYSQ